MNLAARLLALETRLPPPSARGDTGARERLIARLDSIAQRRRLAGITPTPLTPVEVEAIIRAVRERAARARAGDG